MILENKFKIGFPKGIQFYTHCYDITNMYKMMKYNSVLNIWYSLICTKLCIQCNRKSICFCVMKVILYYSICKGSKRMTKKIWFFHTHLKNSLNVFIIVHTLYQVLTKLILNFCVVVFHALNCKANMSPWINFVFIVLALIVISTCTSKWIFF